MELEEAIRRYKSVGHRNAGLFRWFYNIFTRVYIPCIDPKLKENLAEAKTKLAIFNILVDDLADNTEFRNERLLEQAVGVPWHTKIRHKSEYLRVARTIWMAAMDSIKTYQRFNEIEKIFYFDLKQAMLSMEYSFLVNAQKIDNEIENNIHLPNTTMVTTYCDMDLMCSPDFDLKEIGDMRVIINLFQRIAHLGNLISTYPQEIMEGDLSSPILSLAARKGLIKPDDIKEEDLPKIRRLEKIYYAEARKCIENVKKNESRIKSVNMNGFSSSMDLLFTELVNCKGR